MNGWSTTATPLTKGENNVFAVTLTLEPGKYEYKFVVDDNWLQDPENLPTSGDNCVFEVKEVAEDTEKPTPEEPTTYDVTVHWNNSDNWDKVNVWAWTTYNNYSGGQWPGAEAKANADNSGWYDYSMTGVDSSELGIIFNNGSVQTGDLKLDLTKGTEVWVSGGKASPTVSYSAPEGWVVKYNVTLHFDNASNWEKVSVWAWSDTTGENYTGGNWPGIPMTASTEKEGWYDVTFTDLSATDFAFIFNNSNNGAQTADIKYTLSKVNTELWVTGGAAANKDTVLTKEPVAEEPTPEEPTTYDVTVHWNNSDNWNKVNVWAWTDNNNYSGGNWPGAEAKANDYNNGWYDYSMTGVDNSSLGIIFNNGSSQTGDLKLDLTKGTEIWVSGGQANPTISYEAPEKWVMKYTVTLHFFNANNWSEVSVWAWNKDNTSENYTGGTWPGMAVTANTAKEGWYDVTFKDLNSANFAFIFNNNGGGDQTMDLTYTLRKANTELWITGGRAATLETIFTEEPDVEGEEPETEEYRYLVVEYTRDDKDYSDTNVYTWANGLPENTKGYPFEEVNGKWIAKVPVVFATSEMNVGFIVRKGNDWSYAVKDGGDNYAAFPADQNVVKVKFYDKKVTGQYPGNKGAEISSADKAVCFYYRDDVAFMNGTLETLVNKVQVVVKSSEAEYSGTYKMTYDEANGRFTYNVPLKADTDYFYYYLVDGVKVLDAFNDKTSTIDGEEYSAIRNKSYAVDITASIKNASMNYNENNLLYVDWAAKEGSSLEGFVVSDLYADLSELGLGKVVIDPSLKTVSIACDDSVLPGEKTIPVTLVDDCDGSYTTTVNVTIKERTKTANTDSKLGDFDWDEAVIYFAVTDRFYDGNKANNTLVDAADTTDGSRYHGGDLAGLTEKIDYLYDLGINTIWLTPIVDNITTNVRDAEDNADGEESYGYHGYWASDFTKLNPHLGTEAELKALIDAAHAKGMKIMVDVVLNHAGYGTEEHFNTILKDADGNYIDMIRGSKDTVNGDDKLSSLSGLPDFLTENEEVRNQIVEWQTAWMKEFDIDYYRVDTVKHVDNTTWAAFKNALTDANPEFKLIGEYYGASYTSTAGQLDSGKMDSLLDFGFKEYAREFVYGNFATVEAQLAERNGMLDNTSTLGSFLSSHDEAGFLHNIKSESLMKVAATLQITAKGQPVIYYGEEIGLSGANNYPQQDNRYDFDWSKVTAQKDEANSLFNHYKTMLNIRRDYSEIFAKGERGIAAIAATEGYEVIGRSYKGETLYVAMNIKDAAKEVTFAVSGAAGSVYTDVYSNTKYTVAENGTVTVKVPAAANGGTAVLVLTEGENAKVEDTNKVTVKLHYNRPDGDYTNWNVWFWADGMGGNGYEFVEEDGDMVATVTVAGRSSTKVNYIVRKGDWEAKDVDADQSIDISDIVSGTVHFYVNSGVAGGTRILGADAIKGSKVVSSMYDRETNSVKVVVSAPSSKDKNEAFTITRTDGKVIEIASVTYSENTYTLVLKDDISSLKDVLRNYLLRYEDFDYSLGMPNLYASEEFESQYTYEGDDLGATWTKTATTFKVWAPTADSVKVALYKSGTAGTNDLIAEHPMTLGEQGVWSVAVSGNLNGTYYTYIVDVNGETEEACDPYARTTGVNGKRAMVIDLDSTDPAGWDKDFGPKKDMSYTDAVIYELHVRDASIHESSGVSAANKGKFLGLTETGTKTANGVPTVLDHIEDLGVTHVHLLPVYDYGSVDETRLNEAQFNWGYDPVNYNVPEGSYSTNPYDGATRVREMKQMVKALHDNNINVVMDVVYNHVYDAESFSFDQIVPKYFSRTYADGSYSSGSGCGNDTASERAMVQKYIIESVMYWAEEYHIDGFRFDLVGLIDTETMNGVIEAVHAKYPDVIFYGEGWTMATETSKDVSMSTQLNAYMTPELAYFSDTIRNLLAGDNSATNPGFVSGSKGQESALAECVTATTSWCPSPTQTVNYASCHDNYTLKDKLNLTRPDATEADRIKMNNLTAAVYMMSQGIPFIHAGEEFLRTKTHEDGTVEHNSYNSNDYVNALRWTNLEKETYADVADYYKGLIEFRKNHEALRLTTSEAVAENMNYHYVSSNVVLFSLDGKDSVAGEVSDGIVVIFNATEEAKTFSLYDYNTIAEGEWKVCINAEDAGIDVLDTITDGEVTVAPISAMVLVKGETEDKDSVYLDNYREPVIVTPSVPSTPDYEEEDTEAPTTGTTKPSTGTTKPSAGETESTENNETADEPVEVIIPVDGTVAEKTEAIVEAIEDVKEGNEVVIKVIDAEAEEAPISIEVLNALEENKGKDVELVIELANGFSWTINANSVDTSKLENGLEAINFWVGEVKDVVPAELISDVVKENETTMEISLKHDGDFGLTAALDIPVGNEHVGKMATLYYFNPNTNTLEAQAMEKIGESGAVRFLFTHASDYVVVIGEAAEDVVDTEVANTEATEKNTEAVEDTTDVSEEGGNGMTIVIVLLVLALLIVGVVLVKKKKTA